MQKQSRWNIKKKEIITVFIIVISIFLIIEFLSLLFPIEFSIWENRITDNIFRLRYLVKGKEPIYPYLASVSLMNSDIEQFGISITDYSIYGKILKILNDSSARTIGFDILFTDKSRMNDEDLLIKETSESGKIFYPLLLRNISSNQQIKDFSYTDRETPFINKYLTYPHIIKPGEPLVVNSVYLPFPELVNVANGLGHIAVQADWDGVNRQYPLFFKYKNGYIPSLILRMLCDYLNISPGDIEIVFNKSITLKNAVFPSGLTKDILIPVDKKGRMYINFIGPGEDSFLQYSFGQLLLATNPGQFDQYLADSLLIISDKTTYSKDYAPGVFETYYPLSNIHLQVINTILKENFLYVPGPLQELISYFLLIIVLGLSGLLCLQLRTIQYFIIAVIFYLLYVILSILLFFFFTQIPYLLKPSIGYFLTLFILFLHNTYIFTWEIRLINREREVQKEKLIQTNKLLTLGTLASSITHEIANPNNVISLDAATLSENYLIIEEVVSKLPKTAPDNGNFPYHMIHEKIKEGIEGISRNSRRIEKIISELRNFYCKVSAYKEKAVHICKVITSSLFLLSYEIKQTGNVHFTPPDRGIPYIMGNFQHLEQAIVNLLLNACQAIREKDEKRKGEIHISVKQNINKESVDVIIIDNGVGMTQDILDNITKPFFSTKIEKGGTGLGLYITQKIIEKHRGKIEFHSTRGEGTKVMINFPYSNETLFLKEFSQRNNQ